MGQLPTFLLIGAAKSGTTSLWFHLRRHPDVFLPDHKEPEYFAYAGAEPVPDYKPVVTNLADYQALFEGAGPCRGEASPAYLYFRHVAASLHETIPNAKLIAILRHPIDRAFSHYLNARRALTEPASHFEDAVAAELNVLSDPWHVGDWPRPYLRFSLYGRQLERYYAHFPAEQIHVCLFEQFKNEPKAVLDGILEFLGVDPDRLPKAHHQETRNSGWYPRSYRIHRWLNGDTCLRRTLSALLGDTITHRLQQAGGQLNRRSRPSLSSKTRQALAHLFRPDVEQLSALTGQSFALWDLREPTESDRFTD